MRPIFFATLPLFVIASDAMAQPRCTKGIPCGNSCIAANKVCRTGPGSATRGGEPTTAPNVEAVAAGALGLGNFSALADRSNPRLPWVVSRAGGTYYRNGCGGGARIPPKERLYFRTEGEVQRIGFARATDSQDACDAKALAWHRALIDSAASPVATSVERVESAADSSWVASVADGVYFRRGCSASQDLAPANRKYFRTEAAAIAEGYRRSRTLGC